MNDRCPYLGMSLLQCVDGNRHQPQNIALPEAVDSQMLQCRPDRLPAWQRFSEQNIFAVFCYFSLASYFEM